MEDSKSHVKLIAGAVEVSIVSSLTSSFTEYQILVEDPQTHNYWYTSKRYRDFDYLRKKVLASHPHLFKANEITFPAKRFMFGNLSKEVVNERKTDLEVFLQTVVRKLSESKSGGYSPLPPPSSAEGPPPGSKESIPPTLPAQHSMDTELAIFLSPHMVLVHGAGFPPANGIYVSIRGSDAYIHGSTLAPSPQSNFPLLLIKKPCRHRGGRECEDESVAKESVCTEEECKETWNIVDVSRGGLVLYSTVNDPPSIRGEDKSKSSESSTAATSGEGTAKAVTPAQYGFKSGIWVSALPGLSPSPIFEVLHDPFSIMTGSSLPPYLVHGYKLHQATAKDGIKRSDESILHHLQKRLVLAAQASYQLIQSSESLRKLLTSKDIFSLKSAVDSDRDSAMGSSTFLEDGERAKFDDSMRDDDSSVDGSSDAVSIFTTGGYDPSMAGSYADEDNISPNSAVGVPTMSPAAVLHILVRGAGIRNANGIYTATGLKNGCRLFRRPGGFELSRELDDKEDAGLDVYKWVISSNDNPLYVAPELDTMVIPNIGYTCLSSENIPPPHTVSQLCVSSPGGSNGSANGGRRDSIGDSGTIEERAMKVLLRTGGVFKKKMGRDKKYVQPRYFWVSISGGTIHWAKGIRKSKRHKWISILEVDSVSKGMPEKYSKHHARQPDFDKHCFSLIRSSAESTIDLRTMDYNPTERDKWVEALCWFKKYTEMRCETEGTSSSSLVPTLDEVEREVL